MKFEPVVLYLLSPNCELEEMKFVMENMLCILENLAPHAYSTNLRNAKPW